MINMRDFTIITDSTCDLTSDIIDRYGIKISLLSVLLGDNQYKNYPDGRDISNKELYANMRNKKLPTTSACNAEDFKEVMIPELKKGNDILYIGFSSAMSCSYNVGCVVAEELREEYPEAKIITVDSLSAALAQGLLVMLAAMEKEKGKTIEEVAQYVEDNKMNMCHAFTVDDLFHIMRGGRATKTSAIIGSLLLLKPILRINEAGLIETVGTVRGRKKALREVLESVRANLTDPDMPIFIGHGDCEEEANQFAELCRQELGLTNVYVAYIGAVCGCHGGPGLLGVFYHGQNRNIKEEKLSNVS